MRLSIKCCIMVIGLLWLCSCANYKDIPYFQNAVQYDGSKGVSLYDMTIKPKDQLSIFVTSGKDQAAVSAFNMFDPAEIDNKAQTVGVRGRALIHYYLVDNEGNIDFPVLGKVHVEGLTLDSANCYIKKLISPYLQAGIDCNVNAHIVNYNVTVMGEVQYPNTFKLTRPKVSVLEALAMAGDMTIYGKRDNVKVLREKTDGTYEVHELDMRDANTLNSPYYYLQQRDIVYVEPNIAMVQDSKIGTTTKLWVRGAHITISLGTLIYRVLQD